ncbi:MAG: hypothetical protein GXP33_16435 [Spirochaetes bacterium]|nr:hypothetical protein [Spirochaetota bacterium]
MGLAGKWQYFGRWLSMAKKNKRLSVFYFRMDITFKDFLFALSIYTLLRLIWEARQGIDVNNLSKTGIFIK